MSEHSELVARASKTNHGNSDVAVAGCNCEACFNLRGELVNSHCAECGMALITAGEYHPYAACALYKQWGDSHAVRANLAAIIEHGNKPTGNETRELQLLKEARSFIQHDKRCWGASHEDDCTCGYVDFAKKLAFLDEPAKEVCAHGKRRDDDCAYCPGSFTAPPIDPWADMKKNCTCPKPGTSSSKIDPLCPIGLPHPWDRDAQKANSCVCGEPNSPGTHRTDGPCLAPIGDRR